MYVCIYMCVCTYPKYVGTYVCMYVFVYEGMNVFICVYALCIYECK